MSPPPGLPQALCISCGCPRGLLAAWVAGAEDDPSSASPLVPGTGRMFRLPLGSECPPCQDRAGAGAPWVVPLCEQRGQEWAPARRRAGEESAEGSAVEWPDRAAHVQPSSGDGQHP